VICESCKQERDSTVAAVVSGVYYRDICKVCVTQVGESFSSGVASFDRRRGYEDNAHDTVQPYDAAGPNPEFYRLFPNQAKKVFSKEVIEQLKRKI
jgi:hypothetical protein